MLNYPVSIFIALLLYVVAIIFPAFGLWLHSPWFIIAPCFFVILLVLCNSVVSMLLVISVYNLLFLSTYTPLFGAYLAFIDSVHYGNLRMAIGLRPVVVSLSLLLSLVIIFLFEKKLRLLIFVFLFICFLGFLGNPGVSAIVYLLNSWIPLFSILICGLYLVDLQASKSSSPINVPVSQIARLNSEVFIYLLIGGVFLFGILAFISYHFAYEFVRPDLITSIRTSSGEPINYGEFPDYWYSLLYGLKFLRYAGGFPDAIVYGYFCAFCSLFFFIYRRYVWSGIFLVLVTFSFSKGAVLFLIQALLLVMTRQFGGFFSIMACALFVMFQIFMAGILDTSASVHLEGLVSGLKSMFSNGIEPMLLGHGMGDGGNMERIVDLGRAPREIWLASGSESGIGVLAYQLGSVGLLVLIYSYYLIYKITSKPIKHGFKNAMYFNAGINSLLVNMFLQETVVNASVICVFLFFFILSYMKDANSNS